MGGHAASAAAGIATRISAAAEDGLGLAQDCVAARSRRCACMTVGPQRCPMHEQARTSSRMPEIVRMHVLAVDLLKLVATSIDSCS